MTGRMPDGTGLLPPAAPSVAAPDGAAIPCAEPMFALLLRLARASGPNRELDLLIGQAGGDLPLHWRWTRDGGILDAFDRREEATPRITESLDAAVALVERVLPAAEWAYHSTIGTATIYPADYDHALNPNDVDSGVLATPAMSVCDALLKVLIASAGEAAPATATTGAAEGEHAALRSRETPEPIPAQPDPKDPAHDR